MRIRVGAAVVAFVKSAAAPLTVSMTANAQSRQVPAHPIRPIGPVKQREPTTHHTPGSIAWRDQARQRNSWQNGASTPLDLPGVPPCPPHDTPRSKIGSGTGSDINPRVLNQRQARMPN